VSSPNNGKRTEGGAGNLYGTTSVGGFYGYGTVFELTPSSDGTWAETTLYAFTGGSDGGTPMAGLVFDGDGNFYGTTESGGGGPCDTLVPSGCGTVFKLNRSPDGSWAEGVLHAFAGCDDEANPRAGLIFDANGNVYGTTSAGGTACNGGNGVGFKLASSGSSWTENVLHRFQGGAGDGLAPWPG
jgi:uncharacterized repeat protein (TIGR03803 family)